jgi:hypothetical protein
MSFHLASQLLESTKIPLSASLSLCELVAKKSHQGTKTQRKHEDFLITAPIERN